MANVHTLFEGFHQNIQITATKKSRLTTSKDGLRERIKKHFKEHHEDYVPKFFIQGSYKMGTAIRTKDDTCDLDDGIYFHGEPDVTFDTLQQWVKDAIEGYTDTSPSCRKKCVTTIFLQNGEEIYNIDHPIYYQVKEDSTPLLGVKTLGWSENDPKAFVNWFQNHKKNAVYGNILVRVCRYLKAWGDNKNNLNGKMPSGMALTILATNAIQKIDIIADRDDKMLVKVLEEMQTSLKSKWECIVPTTPYDNLFENFTETRKKNFLDRLKAFIEDANKALEAENYKAASLLWYEHLGDRFPLGEDKIDQEQCKINELLKTAALISSGKTFTDKNGKIQSENGTKNQSHHFYGD